MNQPHYDWPDMHLTPVGVVQSALTTPSLGTTKDNLKLEPSAETFKKQHEAIKTSLSEILIFEPWQPLLKGIEGFSHILVLYWPHLVPPERRKLEEVHPMGRKDMPLQGIFATCSPARPNPILVSAVELVERNRSSLTVKGLEAVDQRPVIDIKPYNVSYMKRENLRSPQWMQQLNAELDS